MSHVAIWTKYLFFPDPTPHEGTIAARNGVKEPSGCARREGRAAVVVAQEACSDIESEWNTYHYEPDAFSHVTFKGIARQNA